MGGGSGQCGATPQQKPAVVPTNVKTTASAGVTKKAATTPTIIKIPAAPPKAKVEVMEEKRTQIAIILYTMYGHIATLAKSIKQGVESTGAQCTIFQVAETLPDDVLKQMHAPPKPDYPIITPEEMEKFDGFMFGISGRFGIMPAQLKTFMDSTGGLWKSGALVGKAAGVFTSVGSQGGGQETGGLATVTFFAHHGMVFVPLGGSLSSKRMRVREPNGGTAYGCGTFAGSDGSRTPNILEKPEAVNHGKHFANVTEKLAT
mmetsp:Transcript_649/g.1182  ORF Transcript_649/g.1182 Transcript_649/m.1182 type:complete len:260 (-) Transcript_649:339-1118(-)